MIWPGNVAGTYTLQRVLGCGGVGIVVAARHTQLGHRVALKFLRPDRPRDREARERLIREGRITAQIRSPHVARVLAIDTTLDGEPYLVMERLEGCDLAESIAEHGPMARGDAVAAVRQACVGLAAAHELGIVHGDLKPSNLFRSSALDGSPRIVVLDFGSAEESTAVFRAANSIDMGSPPFVAPEQLRAEGRASVQSDVWALGAVLFTLLAGHSPFERRYLSETYRAILSGKVPELRASRVEVPRALRGVVERCLSESPAQRFASVTELAAALAPWSRAPRASAARPLRASSHGRQSEMGR